MVRAGSPREEMVATLLEELDQYLHQRYPPDSNYIDDVAALSQSNVRFAVVEVAGVPVGCGAVKLLHDALTGVDYAEVKRVFVSPRARGQGASQRLMDWLEDRAHSEGARFARLETGGEQPEALSLYATRGYQYRDAFGAYRGENSSLSLFMEKKL